MHKQIQTKYYKTITYKKYFTSIKQCFNNPKPSVIEEKKRQIKNKNKNKREKFNKKICLQASS